MTYQNLIQKHDDKADEASSLLLTVAGGGGGVPATKKKHSVPMRAMIATFVLLGSLAVIYGGRGSSSTANSAGISAALLLSQNQAAPLYDSNTDYCFKSKTADQYCWYNTDSFPDGLWKGVGGHVDNNCGPKCTSVNEDDGIDDDVGDAGWGW